MGVTMTKAVDDTTTTRISLREAVERVGSLDALLPLLREGRVFALHSGTPYWPDDRTINTNVKVGPLIPPEWWNDAKVDLDTNSAIFTVPMGNWEFEVLLIEIGLALSAVEVAAATAQPPRPAPQKAAPPPALGKTERWVYDEMKLSPPPEDDDEYTERLWRRRPDRSVKLKTFQNYVAKWRGRLD
jgi:hypothetical protein